MAYFYFKEKRLYKIALDDNEKIKLSTTITVNNAVEKVISEEQFYRIENGTHEYLLDDSNNIVETEKTSSNSELDTVEASAAGTVPSRLGVLYNETNLKLEISDASNFIQYYLNNTEDEQWSTYQSALNSFVVPTSGYPMYTSLVKLLKDQGISALSLLRLP